MSTQNTPNTPLPLLAVIIAGLSLIIGGWFIGDGLKKLRTDERTVMVRGLAEQDAVADLAIWPIRFVATGDTLGGTQGKIEADLNKIERFLTSAGFAADNISLQRLEVTDHQAQNYNRRGGKRFTIAQNLTVRTTDVDLVQATSRKMGDLVKQGVVLQGWQGPSYIYTQLNDIKPGMIAKATANAREAAQQFAKDSGANLGGIKTATQGYFSIQPRDSAGHGDEKSQINKRIRVVTSVTYSLGD